MPTPWDFDDVRCTGNMGRDRGEGKDGASGEYEQQAWPGAPVPQDTNPVPGADRVYPNVYGYGYDATNPQFSQDKPNDPRDVLESTRASVQAHADLLAAYGLMMPVATLGNHPFLRDELSDPTDREPGAEQPSEDCKVPKRKGV